jgi:hypothetical protein
MSDGLSRAVLGPLLAALLTVVCVFSAAFDLA